jgi:hypothetical protein
MSQTVVQKQGDTQNYQQRNDPSKNNANLYIANNANPFLISPFAPVNLTGLAKASVLNELSTALANVITDLSSVINLSSFTLGINNITPVAGYNTLTLANMSTFNVNMNPINGQFNMTGYSANWTFGQRIVITTPLLQTSNILIGSTISTNYVSSNIIDVKQLTYSSLSGNSMDINNLNVNQRITTSSLWVTGDGSISSFRGSSIIGNTLNVTTLTASTLNVREINTSSLYGSTLTTQYTYYSSLIGSSINTSTIYADTATFAKLAFTNATVTNLSTTQLSSVTVLNRSRNL